MVMMIIYQNELGFHMSIAFPHIQTMMLFRAGAQGVTRRTQCDVDPFNHTRFCICVCICIVFVLNLFCEVDPNTATTKDILMMMIVTVSCHYGDNGDDVKQVVSH